LLAVIIIIIIFIFRYKHKTKITKIAIQSEVITWCCCQIFN